MKKEMIVTKEMMEKFKDVKRRYRIVEGHESSHCGSATYCRKTGKGCPHEESFTLHSCGCLLCQAYKLVCEWVGEYWFGQKIDERVYELALKIYERGW